MSRLYLVAGAEEIARRRGLVPAGGVVEAWSDLYRPGLFWMGEESKALLDAAGDPISAEVALPAGCVSIYYGPRVHDLDSLPPEASLKARVLSARGIAVAWITLDRFGQRVAYEPQSPRDPIFYLRRRGGGAAHLWRVFQTRSEAATYMAEHYGADAQAAEWAEGLAIENFDALLETYRTR